MEMIRISDEYYVNPAAVPELIEQGILDGDPVPLPVQAAEAATAALDGLKDYVTHVGYNFKLEARMLVFDAFHGTNYRQIRHDLIEQKRRERFEASIGLSRIK